MCLIVFVFVFVCLLPTCLASDEQQQRTVFLARVRFLTALAEIRPFGPDLNFEVASFSVV